MPFSLKCSIEKVRMTPRRCRGQKVKNYVAVADSAGTRMIGVRRQSCFYLILDAPLGTILGTGIQGLVRRNSNRHEL